MATIWTRTHFTEDLTDRLVIDLSVALERGVYMLSDFHFLHRFSFLVTAYQ